MQRSPSANQPALYRRVQRAAGLGLVLGAFTLLATAYTPVTQAQCLPTDKYALSILYLADYVPSSETTLELNYSVCNTGNINAVVTSGTVAVSLYLSPSATGNAVPFKTMALAVPITKGVCNNHTFAIPRAEVPPHPNLSATVIVDMNPTMNLSQGIFQCHQTQHAAVTASLNFANPYYVAPVVDVDLEIAQTEWSGDSPQFEVCNRGGTPIAAATNVEYRISESAPVPHCVPDAATDTFQLTTGLAPEACTRVTVSPGRIPSGATTLSVHLDQRCVIAESRDDNNKATLQRGQTVVTPDPPPPAVTDPAQNPTTTASPATDGIDGNDEEPSATAPLSSVDVRGGCSVSPSSSTPPASALFIAAAWLFVWRRKPLG
jgi:hypothetical protein